MDQRQDTSRRQRGPGPLVVAGLVSLGALVSVAGVWLLFSPSPFGQRGPSEVGLPSSAPPVGQPAPDFTLPLFSGGTLSLHSLKGKPVILNFWASWCVPCKTETPLLVDLNKTYGPRGIVFVGVDVEDQERDARAFIKQHHVDYLVVQSDDEKVMNAYSVIGIPTTVFIGGDGMVVDKYAGGFVGPEGEKALRARLERLLAPDKP